MLKKISLLFLLCYSIDVKPIGIVEVVLAGVSARLAYMAVPKIIETLRAHRKIYMPIDLPTARAAKVRIPVLFETKVKAVVAALHVCAVQLKEVANKSLQTVKTEIRSISGFHRVACNAHNFSSDRGAGPDHRSSKQAEGFGFTQVQQNIFSAKGLFPRIYINPENGESKQHARSKYRWQGAFVGSLTTAAVLKAVDLRADQKERS